ncbi:MAG: HAD family hydrolase [Acutalibacteraceae bacterium]
MMKGAIFDLDGTLLDSMFVWDTVGETYLRSLGYEPQEDINEKFRSFSLRQAAGYYRSVYGVTLTEEEIMAGINQAVEKQYLYEVEAKTGIPEFLKALSDAGVKMCVATATDHYLVEAALKRLGLDGYFSEIFTCTEVGAGKQEPLIYREALRHLGTDKDKTVVFEDALYALQTAKNDGFLTAAVYDCREKYGEKMRELADFYIEDFSDSDHFLKSASAI